MSEPTSSLPSIFDVFRPHPVQWDYLLGRRVAVRFRLNGAQVTLRSYWYCSRDRTHIRLDRPGEIVTISFLDIIWMVSDYEETQI